MPAKPRCRSGRHWSVEGERCRACGRAEDAWRVIAGDVRRGRWQTPRPNPELQQRLAVWAARVDAAIAAIRATEGHSGDQAWQTLGGYLGRAETAPPRPRRRRQLVRLGFRRTFGAVTVDTERLAALLEAREVPA